MPFSATEMVPSLRSPEETSFVSLVMFNFAGIFSSFSFYFESVALNAHLDERLRIRRAWLHQTPRILDMSIYYKATGYHAIPIHPIPLSLPFWLLRALIIRAQLLPAMSPSVSACRDGSFGAAEMVTRIGPSTARAAMLNLGQDMPQSLQHVLEVTAYQTFTILALTGCIKNVGAFSAFADAQPFISTMSATQPSIALFNSSLQGISPCCSDVHFHCRV